MKRIVYYIASSLDGFIAGENDDISQFIMHGKGVEKYHSDLKQFKTVMMGRSTYEFGYRYGLNPGEPAYPNMEHYIFSNNLLLDGCCENVRVFPISLETVIDIKQKSSTDIYLCGGGQLAGWLLENQMIDVLKIKLNPILIGDGTKLFGQSKVKMAWSLADKENFDDGMVILTYTRGA
ncbi:MAG: dihydrofolate reductase family protein [Bacteroidota bacterium]